MADNTEILRRRTFAISAHPDAQKGVTQQKIDAGRAEEHEEQVGGRAYDTLGSHRHDGHSNNKCCQKVEYYCFKC